jgi:glycosyltransferase involved in cell wall biosynthesis
MDFGIHAANDQATPYDSPFHNIVGTRMRNQSTNSFAGLAGAGVVYFGNEWFAENRTSSHHIARRLPKYCRVLYVDSPGLRAPRANTRDLRRLFNKFFQTLRKPQLVADNLWHCTVPQIPFRRVPGVKALNRVFGRWALRRAVAAVGFDRRISWFVVPHVEFLAGELDEELIVYYCIDDYAALPGVDVEAITATDAALARRADQVFVAAASLLEAKTAQNPTTMLSPHGVDYDLFARAATASTTVPQQAAALRHPVIGFFGLLADWIDIGLLSFLARQRPDWTLLLVGHVATNTGDLASLPNVVFVGPQPYESLPGWAKAFDVAIMPYRLNRQVLNANPLKLREYLATGKPVVSVPTMEVQRFTEHVRLATTPEAFLTEIEAALREESAEKKAARMEAVRAMSWDARVTEVLKVVDRALARRSEQSRSARQDR